jgi:hypothetical protein
MRAASGSWRTRVAGSRGPGAADGAGGLAALGHRGRVRRRRRVERRRRVSPATRPVPAPAARRRFDGWSPRGRLRLPAARPFGGRPRAATSSNGSSTSGYARPPLANRSVRSSRTRARGRQKRDPHSARRSWRVQSGESGTPIGDDAFERRLVIARRRVA